jgi:hypothetical protein
MILTAYKEFNLKKQKKKNCNKEKIHIFFVTVQ